LRPLLADLGNPHDRLPPVVHVAGTNGKGSTVASTRAILEAAGHRTHVYTSPHLVRFNERIRLAGRLIDDAPLAAILEEVESVNAGRPITFFEVTTAAAFLAFVRTPADFAVLETGMGGRFDATNLTHPAVTVITAISFDHMQYLGDTLTKIAGDKAGILKPGVPAVIGPQPAEAAAAIAARASEVGTRLFRHGSEWLVEPRGEGWRYRGLAHHDLPLPVLPGRHQIDNAGAAIAAIEQLPGVAVTTDLLRHGLARVEWPARLQRLTRGALAALLRPGAALYLDGGHNEAAGEVIAAWMATQSTPVDLVCGMLSTKPPRKFLAPMVGHVSRLRAVAIPNDALSFPAETVAAEGRAAGIADVAAAPSVHAAIAELAPTAELLLICGSLHLAGTVLAENG
jgi:dihydrofolate synthase/folylpolyglutamate synthase